MSGPLVAISWLELLGLLGVAVLLAVALGYFGHRTPRPNLYRCRFCSRSFERSPYRPFPRRCPHCKAVDWNIE